MHFSIEKDNCPMGKYAVSEHTDENGKLFINCTIFGFKYDIEDDKWKKEIDNHI